MNIVITGAGRGIGLHLTQLALREGYSVLATARKPTKELEHLAKEHHIQLQIASVEMTNPECGAEIAAACKKWSHVDVLINNAGIYRESDREEDFLDSFKVNTMAPYFISQALFPALKKAKHPKLLQITSLMASIADNGTGTSPVYRASKVALNMVTKCLAVQNPWLTAILMHPGWVKTDMGGASAPTEIDESVSGIWRVLQNVTVRDSGQFFNFRGEQLPW